MNKLELVQRLARECSSTRTFLTTTGQVGDGLLFVGWIDQAWNELQTKHDNWEWMRSSVLLGAGASFPTVSGQASYPLGSGAGTCGIPAANFTKWDPETFRNYTTATGYRDEIWMSEVSYDVWRDSYMYGAQRDVRTRPISIAIGPDKSVCVGPVPNGNYTVTGDYFTSPAVMADDTDVPVGLPVSHHMIIVYDAMRMYAGYQAAPEVYQRGDAGYQRLIRELEWKYLQRLTSGGALA